MDDPYAGWVRMNRGWVDDLAWLRVNAQGFSFTMKLTPPEPPTIYGEPPHKTHLGRTRAADYERAKATYGEYEKRWERYRDGFGEYLKLGRRFLEDVTRRGPETGGRLLIASERESHLFHNAAVLALEAGEESADEARLQYEATLKGLWLGRVIAAHPDWSGRSQSGPRQQALTDYLARHVSLGKVIVRRETAFHADARIQVHPGFWGLFMFSPCHLTDRGFYRFERNDADAQWLAYLSATLAMDATLTQHAPSGSFQVYEKVPRTFADTSLTRPGVYLHRSRAHGRDDFLVLVTGAESTSRRCMVICTKGVGADPELIPASTAGKLPHADRLRNRWKDSNTTSLPFEYPLAGEAETSASWRNLGFCVDVGHDEIATVDFENFGIMYDQARDHRLRPAVEGFVDPYLCIEISCVTANVMRMANLEWGVDKGLIGWPVQVVTAAARETSLRLYKRGEDQDYDYGNLQLELLEWERCYAGTPLPVGLEQAVEDDPHQLMGHLREILRTRGLNDQQVDAQIESLAPALGDLRRRLLLAARIMCGMLASWMVFLDHGWATDTYTGSFSGRNFNSGPRDSNAWGELDRPSELDETPKPSGEGVLCGHVDLGNLSSTLGSGGDLYRSLGLAAPEGLLKPGEAEHEDSLLAARWLWNGSAISDCMFAIGVLTAEAKKQLTQIWQANEQKPEGTRHQLVVDGFRAWLRSAVLGPVTWAADAGVPVTGPAPRGPIGMEHIRRGLTLLDEVLAPAVDPERLAHYS